MNTWIIENRYSFWITFILLATQMLTKEVNLIILCFTLIYFCYLNGFKISMNLPGKLIYFYFLFAGLLIGIINVGLYGNSLYSVIKQIYFFLLPLLFWASGNIVVRKSLISRLQVLNSIALGAIIYSFYDLAKVLFELLTFDGNISIYAYRSVIGTGAYLPIIGVYILIFYRNEIKFGRRLSRFFLIICFSAVVVHFSRTHLLMLIILGIFSGLRTNFSKVAKLVLISIGFLAIASFTFPELMAYFLEKIFNSINEINSSNVAWSRVQIIQNWRGYEMFSELEQFKEAELFEQVFGGGFGSTLEVNGYAYLVSGENTLLFLHNGYYTQLMIWGLAGIVLFFIWCINLFIYGKQLSNKQDSYFLSGIAAVILITTYFVNGPFFSTGQSVFLLYFGMFGALDLKESPIEILLEKEE